VYEKTYKFFSEMAFTRMLYEKSYKLFRKKAPGSNVVRKIIQKLIFMDGFDDAIRKITQVYPPACGGTFSVSERQSISPLH